jgi:hypothetical protein
MSCPSAHCPPSTHRTVQPAARPEAPSRAMPHTGHMKNDPRRSSPCLAWTARYGKLGLQPLRITLEGRCAAEAACHSRSLEAALTQRSSHT